MTVTENMWFGIVMHGLSDYSLVITPQGQAVKNLTSPVQWVAVIFEMVVYFYFGSVLLYMKSGAIAGSNSKTKYP